MTNEILKMAEERKEVKYRDPVQYKAPSKHIHEACRTAKEKWFKDQCEELESLERQFRLRKMHNKVSNLTGKNLKKKSSGCRIDKNGKLLFDKEEIAVRWVEYNTELYDDDRGQVPSFEVTTGENILREEVEKAMRSMKNGKATGPDGLPAEAL